MRQMRAAAGPTGSVAAQVVVTGLVLLLGARPAITQETPPAQPQAPTAAERFESVATRALEAMRERAAALHVSGVAVVAFCEGDSVQSWSSKMIVVGRLKDPSSQPGANLLGIAYAKAAEMADTLKDSGSADRPPMTGEFGWPGGLITKTRTGHVIVAFSGGPSEDDLKVSRAGLDVFAKGL